MSAFAPIVLLDGQPTPVSRTFNPVKINAEGVASFADRSSGIALGFPAVSILVRPASKTSRNYRVSAKVVLPVLEATSPSTATGIQPAPTKAYDVMATIEFVLPERSTLTDRNNVLALARNLLANTNMTNAVGQFESIY